MYLRVNYCAVYWTVVSLICRFFLSWTFNLETRLPVMKTGPRDSYFGYSVAQHQIIHPSGDTENVLLIGAPKAPSFRHNSSGAVYRCSISTFSSEDCRQLVIDQNIDYRQQRVIKDDQWLGVTVESQGPGGYVMACAHRFIIAGDDYQWGQGICFSLKPNLEFGRAWDPCRNRPVNKAHEQYGYCQAGTSGEIAADNTIVIGSPGPFTWRGTIFTNSVTFRIKDDKRWYAGPLLDDVSPVDKYSYLGMSVTSGVFFGESMSFVGGAPRSNGTGQVVFFTKTKSGVTFDIQTILDGEQMASSFGYSLASIDANKDGFLDLVVGAPFYYSKDVGGAIYIYMNSEEGISEYTEPIRMVGKPESRYGFAVENANDLNQDGYPDLVVGAPYEDGSGAVYVYLGSKDGIITTPSQVIKPSDIPKAAGIKTFGYSLDGGIDLDGNSYPDLLVGCYESSTAVLLRSRPVLDIITSVTGELENIDPDKPGCRAHPNSPSVCFSFEACFQFNSSLINAQAVRLEYNIEAETFTGQKYYRVRFNSSTDSETPNKVKNEILMKGSSVTRKHCSSEIVYLKDKTDIQKPVQFKLTYKLVKQDPKYPLPGAELPNVNDYPILNQQEASRIFEAKFLKDCGSDDICETHLDVVADLNLPRDEEGQPILYLGEKEVALSVKVVNLREPAYDAMLFVFHPSSLSFVGRKIVKGDQVECVPFNETVVSCELGNPLKKGEVELQVRFNPKDVQDDERSLQLTVKANTTSKDMATSRKDIILNIGVVKVAELEIGGISQPAQTFYGGDISTVPAFEEDVGNEVIHIYEIINHGPWLATNFEVIVYWPSESISGGEKWLLYMTESPEVLGNGYCDIDPTYLNPMKLKRHPQELRLSPEGYILKVKRRKRDVEPEELRTDGKPPNIATLDCEQKTAKCFHFSCFFKSLERGQTAEIKIKSRLWNSTFVRDYPYVDWVSIMSRAHIIIRASDFQQKEDNDFAFVETKAYPDIQLYQKYEGIPLWIIIISACAGILLLVLLIVILWRCGFFKRKVAGYEPAPSSDKDFM